MQIKLVKRRADATDTPVSAVEEPVVVAEVAPADIAPPPPPVPAAIPSLKKKSLSDLFNRTATGVSAVAGATALGVMPAAYNVGVLAASTAMSVGAVAGGLAVGVAGGLFGRRMKQVMAKTPEPVATVIPAGAQADEVDAAVGKGIVTDIKVKGPLTFRAKKKRGFWG